MCSAASVTTAMTCCNWAATITMAWMSIINWTGTWQTDSTMTRQTLLIIDQLKSQSVRVEFYVAFERSLICTLLILETFILTKTFSLNVHCWCGLFNNSIAFWPNDLQMWTFDAHKSQIMFGMVKRTLTHNHKQSNTKMWSIQKHTIALGNRENGILPALQ